MLDTAAVSFHVSPTPDQLASWANYTLKFSNGHVRTKHFINTHNSHGATLSFFHYPPHPPRFPLPFLSIQASLPAVLFGNNVEQIAAESEIDEAIHEVNNFIAAVPWLPDLDFGAGCLRRLDAVYNHHVGPLVSDYIQALFRLDYPYRKTQPYPYEGVQFKSGTISTSFYDKAKESLSAAASGILRQETKLLHRYYIERKTSLDYPTLRDITLPMLCKILQQDLDMLHLNACTVMDKSTAQQLLIDRYGYMRGNTLFGHLIARQSMSREQIRLQGASARTIQHYEKQITDAGVSLALGNDRLALPPLEIRIPYAKICAMY